MVNTRLQTTKLQDPTQGEEADMASPQRRSNRSRNPPKRFEQNDGGGEDGKIVPGVNTTVDVQPGETERQAKKLFPMNKDGKPKPLGVKGATPHQAFNLGLD